MSSPFIAKTVSESRGKLTGKTAIAAYWKKALNNLPDLRFELIEVLFGVDSICIYYHSVLNMRGVEWFWLDSEGKVKKSMAQYNRFFTGS
jgi:hypothetical protein